MVSAFQVDSFMFILIRSFSEFLLLKEVYDNLVEEHRVIHM
jgi:hypothetical protein